MYSAAQRFSNVVKEGISPILKKQGFKKKGLNYFKSTGDLGYVVNVQKDKWNSKEEIKFTINTGVFSESYWLAELDYKQTKELLPFPKESDCLISERIGQLKFGYDHWYSIQSQRIETKLIKDVKEDIEFYVFPFFNTINTNEKLLTYLKTNQKEDGNDYKLLVMLAELGMKEETQKYFNNLFENCSAHHKTHLKKTAIKYKLSIDGFGNKS